MDISRTRLLFSLIIGIVAISWAATFVRFAQADNVPTLSIAARRLLTTYVAVVFCVAVIPLLALVLVGRRQMLGFGPAAHGWMLTVALVPQLIGPSTLNWVLRRLSAAFVAIVTRAESIGSGILAYMVLGEAVTWSAGGGAILVLTGIYSATWTELGEKEGQGV